MRYKYNKQTTRLAWRDPTVNVFPRDLDLPPAKDCMHYVLLMFPLETLDVIVVASTNEVF